jgi:hypothetical protein
MWNKPGDFERKFVISVDPVLQKAAGHPVGSVTVRYPRTHTAGVPLQAQPKNLYGTDSQDMRDGVLQEALHRRPGEAVECTDRAALILDCLAGRLPRQRLDQLATERT